MLVLHGGLYSSVKFLPTLAPRIVKGKWTKTKIDATNNIVVNGKAAVELELHAIVFTQKKTPVRGIGNTTAVRIAFHTQLLPSSCLKTLPDTNPPKIPQMEYIMMRAVRRAHKMHHKHLTKEDGESFGMLIVPIKYILHELAGKRS